MKQWLSEGQGRVFLSKDRKDTRLGYVFDGEHDFDAVNARQLKKKLDASLENGKTWIGDANNQPIQVLFPVTGADIDIHNFLFVSDYVGDDNDKEIGNPEKPYATHTAALADAVSGQTIAFLSDYVSLEQIILKDGVNIVGFGGIRELRWISLGDDGATIWDNNVAVRCNISNIKTYRQGAGNNRWGAYFQNTGTVIYGNNFHAFSVQGSALVNNGEIHNCYGESTNDDGIDNRGKAYNCTAKTSGDDAFVNIGYAENCSGYSTSFYGFNNYSNIEASPAIAIRCSGNSTANVGFINGGAYGLAKLCYGHSTVSYGIRNQDGKIYDSIGESIADNFAGFYNLNAYAYNSSGISYNGPGFHNSGGVIGEATKCFGISYSIIEAQATGFLNENLVNPTVDCVGRSGLGIAFHNKHEAICCKGFSDVFIGFRNEYKAKMCWGRSTVSFGLDALASSITEDGNFETIFNNAAGHAVQVVTGAKIVGATIRCTHASAKSIYAVAAANVNIAMIKTNRAFHINITNIAAGAVDAYSNYIDTNL